MFALALGLLASAHPSAAGDPGRLDEYQVKAAFLYNFAKFVQWPGDTRDTFWLCTFGDEPFGDVLDRIVKDKRVLGRPITVQRFRKTEPNEWCHILFVSDSEARNAPDLLERMQRLGVLTVGEMPNFLRDGGMIRFFLEDNRVRFDINQDAAQRAGLKINSQLLSLGRR